MSRKCFLALGLFALLTDFGCRVDIFVRQQWTDNRLNISGLFEGKEEYVTRPPEYIDYLWQPDPYILNSKVSGKLPAK